MSDTNNKSQPAAPIQANEKYPVLGGNNEARNLMDERLKAIREAQPSLQGESVFVKVYLPELPKESGLYMIKAKRYIKGHTQVLFDTNNNLFDVDNEDIEYWLKEVPLSTLKGVEGNEESMRRLALEKYPPIPGSWTWNKGGPDELRDDFDENEEYRNGFIEGYKAAISPVQGNVDEGLKLIDIDKPVGDFILNQSDIKPLKEPDGNFYHYADVCTMLNRFKAVQGNVWIKASERLPENNQRILFLPSTEAVNNYKSYRIRFGNFLKKDQFGRENMFCDGAFFEANKIDCWMPVYMPEDKQQ